MSWVSKGFISRQVIGQWAYCEQPPVCHMPAVLRARWQWRAGRQHLRKNKFWCITWQQARPSKCRENRRTSTEKATTACRGSHGELCVVRRQRLWWQRRGKDMEGWKDGWDGGEGGGGMLHSTKRETQSFRVENTLLL